MTPKSLYLRELVREVRAVDDRADPEHRHVGQLGGDHLGVAHDHLPQGRDATGAWGGREAKSKKAWVNGTGRPLLLASMDNDGSLSQWRQREPSEHILVKLSECDWT